MRVLRDDAPLAAGVKLQTLKHLKESVKEVRRGVECGIQLQDYNEAQVGDVLVCYTVREEKRKLGDKK
jgi:translation initiation factor IF-2